MILEAVALGAEVGEGRSRARYAHIKAIAKVSSAIAPYAVANEYIAARLAYALGLPIAPAVLARDEDGGVRFLSLCVGPAGEVPPPLIASQLAADHPDLAARIAAFDSWIGNGDRHRHNVAYVPGLVEPFIFDHDQALFGATLRPEGVAHLQKTAGTPCASHCLAKFLRDERPVVLAGAAIARLGADLVNHVVDQSGAFGLLTPVEADAVRAYLDDRCRNLVDLVRPLAHNYQLTFRP